MQSAPPRPARHYRGARTAGKNGEVSVKMEPGVIPEDINEMPREYGSGAEFHYGPT
jgi:hypothetical protein